MTVDNACSFFFDRPAQGWEDGLPLANGRMGAMVYGGARAEQIALSESTYWSGGPCAENNPPDGPRTLERIRERMVARDLPAVNRLAEGLVGRMLNFGTNLPFGNLRLYFNHWEQLEQNYTRSLDLDLAAARVDYDFQDTAYHREIFASAPHQVLVIRLTCSRPGGLTFRAALDGDEQPYRTRIEYGDLLMDCQAREWIHSDGHSGVEGHARLRILPVGAAVTAQANQLSVEGATEALLLLAIATTYHGEDPVTACRERVERAAGLPYDTLRAAHVAEHQGWFRRCTLDLGPNRHPGRPVDRRLEAARQGEDDPSLSALLFHYGRYLLIGSSRPGSPLPANLNGIWNDNKASRFVWTCDFHLDINTQMNYWIAESTGLPECHLPLFRWIAEKLVPSGRETARQLYGLPGWVGHIVSNAWGYSAPGWHVIWGLFATGGVWIATHLWDHYRFTGDRDFLAGQAYPILKEAAEFCLAYLFEDPHTGLLICGPAYSPENLIVVEGKHLPITVSATVDRVLIDELFAACIQAATELGADADFAARLGAAREKLPPYQVGRHGQLQEWLEDYEEAYPGHRHTSHLLGLYPFAQITPRATPELARAARVSIERRLAAPDFVEGAFTCNNITLFYARLKDGAAAARSLSTFFRIESANSLMIGTRLAPIHAYELDYTAGAAAGITEMLIQSHDGCIEPLPALPPAWSEGTVTGLRARDGFEVSLAWRAGRLERAEVRSLLGRPCRVRAGVALTVTCAGERVAVGEQDGVIEFATAVGKVYRLAVEEKREDRTPSIPL